MCSALLHRLAHPRRWVCVCVCVCVRAPVLMCTLLMYIKHDSVKNISTLMQIDPCSPQQRVAILALPRSAHSLGCEPLFHSPVCGAARRRLCSRKPLPCWPPVSLSLSLLHAQTTIHPPTHQPPHTHTSTDARTNTKYFDTRVVLFRAAALQTKEWRRW